MLKKVMVVSVINQLFLPCDALGGFGRRSYGSSKEVKGYSDPGPAKHFSDSSLELPAQNSTRRGLGVSAWGLVIIIVALILAGMGFYYFSICYPIMCKKTRKYDMIGHPTVA